MTSDAKDKPSLIKSGKIMRYRRVKMAGTTYFFTVNLLDRKQNLLTAHINRLRYCFQKVKARHPFTLDAIVILPDHLHAMMTLPAGDADYSQRWNLIKGCFSRAILATENISMAREKKRERGIWQRRFWEHVIRDEKDFEHHVNYIHYNPVKHGLVKKVVDWPYSSFHAYVARNILPANWAVGFDEINEGFGE